MTKTDLAYRTLKTFFPRMSTDSKVTMREMVYSVGNARDALIAEWIRGNHYQTGDKDIWGGFLSPTYNDVEILKENNTLYYAQLPSKPIMLPGGTGLYRVVPVCDGSPIFSDEFVQVPPSFQSLYSKSLALSLDGQNGYWQEADKIYLVGVVDDETKLDITMIEASEAIDDDAFLPFPADMELELMKRARELFEVTVQIPEDVSDNNKADS
jgi:hypothetical protein